jgi:RNase H-like domain found in reverse transcriptase
MRNAVPEFARVVAPINDLLQKVYKKVKSRRRAKVRNGALTEWTRQCQDAYQFLKSSSANSVKLAFPTNDRALCLFTDASDTRWSAVVTQVPNEQLDLPLYLRQHILLTEFERLDKYLAPREVLIYSNHRNLAYIFDPLGKDPTLAKRTVSKLQRWALKLSIYRYVITHIAGEDNVRADLLSRRAVQPRLAVRKLVLAPVAALQAVAMDKEEWLTWKICDGIATSSSRTTSSRGSQG